MGQLGDCGVIATMGGVAHHRPETITDLFRTRDDGSIEVNLHEARMTRYGADPTGDRARLLVTPEVPVRRDDPNMAAFANSSRAGVAWPAVLEKAFAGVDGTWPEEQAGRRSAGYTRLDSGSTSLDRAELMTQLTGRPADIREFTSGWRDETRTEDGLRSLLDARSPIIVATRAAPDRRELVPGLQGSHAYEVAGAEDGMVSLHNPWGFRHPPPLRVRDFLNNVQPYYTALRPEEAQR